ncbi:hypothetical protein Tamer19_57130 [Cupriavidus sp. TA19]|nr:hypothetical protein Tamer19_57130 [Cupriavidus sp. TA19]
MPLKVVWAGSKVRLDFAHQTSYRLAESAGVRLQAFEALHAKVLSARLPIAKQDRALLIAHDSGQGQGGSEQQDTGKRLGQDIGVRPI